MVDAKVVIEYFGFLEGLRRTDGNLGERKLNKKQRVRIICESFRLRG